MTTPARQRIERYAALAPEGATVEITEESDEFIDLAHMTITGSIDTILITASNRPGRTRTRARGSWWFNSGGGGLKDLKVRDLGYRIRHLYIDRREHSNA